MKLGWVKSLLASLLIVTIAGCSLCERQQLEEEQKELVNQREGLRRQLDRHPINTKWATHPDMMKVADRLAEVNGQISQLEQRLQDLPYDKHPGIYFH